MTWASPTLSKINPPIFISYWIYFLDSKLIDRLYLGSWFTFTFYGYSFEHVFFLISSCNLGMLSL